MDASSSMMPLQNHHPRGRCVSLEENLDDADAVSLAAQANDAAQEDQDAGSVLGKGDTFSYLSSMYRPRRTVSGSSLGPASAAVEAAAAEDQIIPSSNKRQSSSLDLDADEIKMPPPKKMTWKKNQRTFTEFHVDDGLIYPTHLLFTQSPKAPKKVSRTKRRVLCSVMGCSNTSFHNGGMCFNHGGNRSINPINLFSAHQT